MCIRIPLTKGKFARFDDCDAALAKTSWYFHTGGYAARKPYKGSHEYLHRTIAARLLGRALQPGEVVDHINGDQLDNRRQNIRITSHAKNLQNQHRRSDNQSGYKGVRYNRWTKGLRFRWSAEIKADGIRHYLGYFPTAIAAAEAYDDAARRLHGKFARLNFPDSVSA